MIIAIYINPYSPFRYLGKKFPFPMKSWKVPPGGPLGVNRPSLNFWHSLNKISDDGLCYNFWKKNSDISFILSEWSDLKCVSIYAAACSDAFSHTHAHSEKCLNSKFLGILQCLSEWVFFLSKKNKLYH